MDHITSGHWGSGILNAIFNCSQAMFFNLPILLWRLNKTQKKTLLQLTGFLKSLKENSNEEDEDFKLSDMYSEYLRNCADDLSNEKLEDELPEILFDDNCFTYVGTVTYIGSESGMVDQLRFFERINAPADLKDGELVTVLACRKDPHGKNWDVLRLYRYEANVQAPITSIPNEKFKVMKRHKQKFILDNGCVIDLDKVSTEFTPHEGDIIHIKTMKCPDSDKLTVQEICWSEYRTLLSRVSKWNSSLGEGEIDTKDEPTFFNQDACTPGYRPKAGDHVCADSIKTVGGWRALLVVYAGTPTRIHRSLNSSVAELDYLCLSKHGIVIKADSFDFGKVRLGRQAKTIMIKVVNTGTRAQTLMNIGVHSAHRFMQTSPTILSKNSVIRPGKSLKVLFKCVGKFLGHSIEIPIFFFKGFKVGFVFKMEIVHQDTSRMETESSSSLRAPRFYHALKIERNQHILCGERPIQPPKFIECRLGHYNVPDRFWVAFLNHNNESKATPDIQKDIEEIAPCLKSYLEFSSYGERFHTLLYLEEVDAMLKLQRYKMEKTVFTVEGEYLRLNIPGLSEKRPALLVGDIVLASCPWREENKVYEGFVHKTFDSHILLKFNPDFHMSCINNQYNIEFKFGRTALRRQHSAIDVAVTHLGKSLLFPSRLKLKLPQLHFTEQRDDDGISRLFYKRGTDMDNKIPPEEVVWFNSNLNEFQKGAIVNVLAGVARPLPYIIFGPPGTGKTMTLVELILKIFLLLPESRMLIATPSNSSANLIAERLIGSGHLKPGDLVRLVGYHVYEDKNLPPGLLEYCTTGNIKMMVGEEAEAAPAGMLGMSSNKSTLISHRIVIGTCIALGQLFTMGIPHGSFTHVLVDEAGQATEPEILVALDFLNHKEGQIILAGDPMQLGPVVGSNLANQYGLGESYLDRLLHRFPYQADRVGYPDTEGYDPRLISFLLKNYRTLPEILSLPNDLFYESKLLPQLNTEDGPEVNLLRSFASFLPHRPEGFTAPPAIVFHGVRATNLQETESPSWFNPVEAVVVLSYVEKLYQANIAANDIGIITPYRKQVQKMRRFYSQKVQEVPKIGSVEEFQGQERKVIILSAVRSSSKPEDTQKDVVHSLGFVSSPKRLNVALTRAQVLLIVIGNPHVLAIDSDWKATLKYCLKNNSYWGCDAPLNLMPSVSQYVSF